MSLDDCTPMSLTMIESVMEKELVTQVKAGNHVLKSMKMWYNNSNIHGGD